MDEFNLSAFKFQFFFFSYILSRFMAKALKFQFYFILFLFIYLFCFLGLLSLQSYKYLKIDCLRIWFVHQKFYCFYLCQILHNTQNITTCNTLVF